MTEKMTAADAVRFETFSPNNAAIVETSRACSCEAYKDIFTYKRWKAQGMQVQKGEKATTITTYRPITKTDEATGEEIVVARKPRKSFVFCRCQVAPIKPKRTPQVEESALELFYKK